jgi:hypothetical protein
MNSPERSDRELPEAPSFRIHCNQGASRSQTSPPGHHAALNSPLQNLTALHAGASSPSELPLQLAISPRCA